MWREHNENSNSVIKNLRVLPSILYVCCEKGLRKVIYEKVIYEKLFHIVFLCVFDGTPGYVAFVLFVQVHEWWSSRLPMLFFAYRTRILTIHSF